MFTFILRCSVIMEGSPRTAGLVAAVKLATRFRPTAGQPTELSGPLWTERKVQEEQTENRKERET